MPFRKTLSLFGATLASLIVAAPRASAYQTDCAILLCLAGGFRQVRPALPLGPR